MHANGTQNYARLHCHGLTLPQQNAVDLLAGGKNDTQVAGLLKLSRVTVTRWRLYSPEFQAALNRRRAEVWGTGVDRLRSLIPQALDVLGEALTNGDQAAKLKAAGMVLEIARLPDPAPSGPTSAEDIIAAQVKERYSARRTRRLHEEFQDEEQAEDEREAQEEVLAELEARLSETTEVGGGD
jgi:hypothetical protein